MKNFYATKTRMKKVNLKNFLIALFFLSNFHIVFSQNYRMETAYIDDFSKNELYVKECIVEYTKSIMENNSDERKLGIINKIYTKLNNVNEILLKNDKGIFDDTSLRDAFLNLNNRTIRLLKTKILKLDDYKEQSQLSIPEMEKSFAFKENEMRKYYEELRKYEKLKKSFGLKYGVILKTADDKNILEYNAYQNLTFYKLNVVDEKLMNLINTNNSGEVLACVNFLNRIAEESLQTMEKSKREYTDSSLETANKDLIDFLLKQNDKIIPMFSKYASASIDLENIKKLLEDKTKPVNADEYNAIVKNFNVCKNVFFNNINDIQISKAEIINNWAVVNSTFLKKNAKLENIYDDYKQQYATTTEAEKSVVKVKKY